MTINQIKEKLKSKDYDFLRTDKNLGNNIILLTIGGSYAYGTNNENSDVDIRGCALNTKMQILTNQNFEQRVDVNTDTTIYAFNKLVSLLSSVNPNTIELLGNKPEYYFYVHPIGQEMLDNSHLFLSKRAIYSFGGYASQQLRRLSNKANREVSQSKREEYILKSVENSFYKIKQNYCQFPDDSIKLYADVSDREDYDTEIFMDVNLKHYPLRDYKDIWAEMNSVVKSYNKMGKRNQYAIERGKLAKHMMHLVRLYLMCFDILEKEQIITYRDKDHDFLMDIRNGKYLDKENQPIDAFYEIVDELEKRLKYDSMNTSLPDNPDYNKINEFVASVNERVVKGEF
jgi:predicted nucleotidyltransferase